MSRKYRQSGYQDEERGKESSRPQPQRPSGDRLRPERPRGRGLGAPTERLFRCAVCGARQAAPGPGEVAVKCVCGADLHTCTHCAHFDTGARFECRQPVAVRIPRKSQGNECALFAARVTVEHAADKAEPGDARSAFDALFDKL